MQTKKRLYRDTKQGKVAGVCAGLADYFGWEVWVVRILCVTALIFSSSIAFVAYIVAWVVLDKKPQSPDAHSGRVFSATAQTIESNEEQQVEIKTRVWEAGKVPAEALQDIVFEFQEVETSLQALERCVTSSKYQIEQEFNRL